MPDQPKQINFTIVPDDATDSPRAYANFCAVHHTPFDFTLTFCDMAPLSEKGDAGGGKRNGDARARKGAQQAVAAVKISSRRLGSSFASTPSRCRTQRPLTGPVH